ncbi:MAG: ATP-dependent DNA helicase RecG [Lachnospiraceae bacterium]|nr:ATP-dependent DNA helicase RecG [Lachnospiraceae bacterium]
MNDYDSVDILKGVGAKSKALFLKCNVNNIKDLGDYYPRTYESFLEPTTFSKMKLGERCAVSVKVHSRMVVRPARRLKLCLIDMVDSEGAVNEICWFNMPFLANVFNINQQYVIVGEVTKRGTKLTINHPKYYTLEEYEHLKGSFQPVYPLTEGLSNNLIIKSIKQLEGYFKAKKEYLDDDFLKSNDMMRLSDAYINMHFPGSLDTLILARNRIVFHEFFKFLMSLNRLKESNLKTPNNFNIKEDARVHKFITNLPYDLTRAQKETYEDILSDITGKYTMNRLVQGDVGSGKTVVALLALLTVILSGYQGAMMAPTEVLARQHYKKLKDILKPYGIDVSLLTGSVKGAERKEVLNSIATHDTDLIIGTHALIQESVKYNNLALVVTDEQHRFGVKQRERFINKGNSPHVLIMSATPIPRTLAMMLFGDMDISVMDEKPANRLPIKNCVVGVGYRKASYKFMHDEINKGHQCYVICPMVCESDNNDAEDVISYSETLKDELPNANIAYLHGKMKEEDKNSVLSSFAKGEVDILVFTTVVEVGIDVPNATFIMIENAERFGLAQLHQLRGRVGRGDSQSYAVFMYGKEDEHIKERLNVLADSNDGFYIAKKDLELRGPGDFFGIRQSGIMNFKVGDIYQDGKLLSLADKKLKDMIAEGVDLSKYKELDIPKDIELAI